MTLITDKPEDLDSTNELDHVDDPELNDDGTSIDRYLAFGTTPRPITNPPKRGEVVTYQVKVECVGEGWKERSDGEIRYSTDLHVLSVARVGDELPPDFKSKKQEEAEAKAAAKAAAKGKGLYDDPATPTLPLDDAAVAAEMAEEQAAEDATEVDEYDQDAQ
jgi:hypothetical protein